MERKQRIHAPIRYGRLSAKNTDSPSYTMVFARSCARPRRRLGTAWAVPFRTPTDGEEELRVEASELARAETNRATYSQLSNDWFTVGIIVNPHSPMRRDIQKWWGRVYGQIRDDHDLRRIHLKSEGSIITRDGCVRVSWPDIVESGGTLDYDYLLATPTVPEISGGRYPTVRQIASSWARNDEYFRRNIDSFITTAQDRELQKHLERGRSVGGITEV
ncbi:hypothetical protein PJI16_14340 [Nitrospira sp. MA-1]|nr:hypothetical protein [Nitrospira sp. MA-1]